MSNSECQHRYYLKNKKRIAKYHKHWKDKNKEKYNVYNFVASVKRQQCNPDDYDELFDRQNGVCAICGDIESIKDHRSKKVRRLSIDHNHRTGKLRGLLCNKCNTAIGKLMADDFGIDLLCSAISYIRNNDE